MVEQRQSGPSATSATSATSTASGKVILLGEHAVVFGAPALVASLRTGVRAEGVPADRSELHLVSTSGAAREEREEREARTTADASSELGKAFNALLESLQVAPVAVTAHVDLPTGVGLGGSAAIGVATARAALRAYGREPKTADVRTATQAWEKVFHGNPSGIDTEAAMGSGVLFYQKPDIAEPLAVPDPMTIAICVAGPAASTLEMVQSVADQLDSNPDGTRGILNDIADTVLDGRFALEEGDQKRLGHLLDVNHDALKALGLSTPDLERARELARGAGALGAKLTGSGGGGCVIALCSDASPILKAWTDAGLECFASTFGSDATDATTATNATNATDAEGPRE
jgi:mevalonate kinase